MEALGCLKVVQIDCILGPAVPWQVCLEECEGHPAGTGVPLPARRRSHHACLSVLLSLCWLLPQGSHFALDQPGALVLTSVPVG